MISNADARRMSPNPQRDIARKFMADSIRAMRRSAYDQPGHLRFVGHLVARSMWRDYRRERDAMNRLILAEALRSGQKVN